MPIKDKTKAGDLFIASNDHEKTAFRDSNCNRCKVARYCDIQDAARKGKVDEWVYGADGVPVCTSRADVDELF